MLVKSMREESLYLAKQIIINCNTRYKYCVACFGMNGVWCDNHVILNINNNKAVCVSSALSEVYRYAN